MAELKDKYIDPFTDFGFKKLFGEECNKDLLLDFLNELLYKKEGKIVSITYIKNDKPGRSESDRKAVFDIHCENEKGEKFIVEIQKSKYNFRADRVSPIVEYAAQGNLNDELKAVYIIAILNYVFEEDKNDDPNKYRYDVMLTNIIANEMFYDKLRFIRLVMPKFNKSVNELETRFEKWMYVIKHLKRLNRFPKKLREKVFEKMFAAAEVAKLSNEEYDEYIEDLNSYRDLQNCIDTARREGIAKGRKERAKGKAERNEQIALKMLADGMSIEIVSKYTGLSVQQIEKLNIL